MSHSTPKHSGGEMVSERMLYPNWAKTAARVLSDKQALFERCTNPLAFDFEDESIRSQPSSKSDGLFCGPQADGTQEKMGETVGGTVSRKGKFGFTCESCSWVPKKGEAPDWVGTIWKPGHNQKQKYMPAHWPDRCRKCRSRMKR